MIIAIILLTISFLLEGFMSIYFPSNLINPSILSCLYTLITLIIIYPYFYNEKKYYILLIAFGLLIDIVYSNTFLFNTILFLLLSIIIKILNVILPNNIFTINVKSLVIIIVYHILSFVLLSIVDYNGYTFNLLFDIIINSIIMTLIYTSLSYFIAKFLFKKYDKLIK